VPWCECDIRVDYPNYCSSCYVKFLCQIRKEFMAIYPRFCPYYESNLVEIAKQIDHCKF
jgi:hypothetical protein